MMASAPSTKGSLQSEQPRRPRPHQPRPPSRRVQSLTWTNTFLTVQRCNFGSGRKPAFSFSEHLTQSPKYAILIVPAKETAHMRPKKRLFIIQYEAANGEKGLQCIEAQTPEALTK